MSLFKFTDSQDATANLKAMSDKLQVTPYIGTIMFFDTEHASKAVRNARNTPAGLKTG
jgi:hypothetical protein